MSNEKELRKYTIAHRQGQLWMAQMILAKLSDEQRSRATGKFDEACFLAEEIGGLSEIDEWERVREELVAILAE